MSRVNIGSLHIAIGGDSLKLGTAVNGAVGQVKRLATETQALDSRMSAFTKGALGAVAAFGALKGISLAKDFAFDGLKLAADLETVSLQFEVMLGDAKKSKKLIDEIFELGAKTPFQAPELLEASRQLLAYGFSAEQIKPVLTSLGDISAGTGADINDLAQIFGRAKVEGRLMGDDLNRLTDRAIPVLDLFAEQLGVGTDQIRKLASEGRIGFAELAKAFDTLTSEGGRFAGLMDKLSASTSGQLSTLKDEADALKREFGTGLLPAYNDLIEITREFVTGGDDVKSTLEGFRELGELTADAFRALAGSIQLARGELAFLVQLSADYLNTLPRLVDAIAGTDYSQPLKIAGESLDKQTRDLIDSGKRLFDFEKSLRDPKPASTGEKQQGIGSVLGDLVPKESLDSLIDDTKAAQDEFDKLGDSASKAADTIRSEFGLTSNPALERGSQAAEAALFKHRYSGDRGTGGTGGTGDKLQEQVQAAVAIAREAVAQAPAFEAVREQAKQDFRLLVPAQRIPPAELPGTPEARLAAVDRISDESRAVVNATYDELKKMLDSIRSDPSLASFPEIKGGASTKHFLDAFGSTEKFLDALKNDQKKKGEPSEKETAKVKEELIKQAAMDRPILTRIAAAVENPKDRITIREYSA